MGRRSISGGSFAIPKDGNGMNTIKKGCSVIKKFIISAENPSDSKSLMVPRSSASLNDSQFFVAEEEKSFNHFQI